MESGGNESTRFLGWLPAGGGRSGSNNSGGEPIASPTIWDEAQMKRSTEGRQLKSSPSFITGREWGRTISAHGCSRSTLGEHFRGVQICLDGLSQTHEMGEALHFITHRSGSSQRSRSRVFIRALQRKGEASLLTLSIASSSTSEPQVVDSGKVFDRA